MMRKKPKMPPVMILCGGKGTRLREVTEMLPKPMVPIGEQPILWHIMKSYAAFGCRRFILCLGYKREAFVDYFANYHLRTSDATISLGHGSSIKFHGEVPESDWEVTLAGTGLETMTGGRVARAAKYLAKDENEFFLTYGDGVADVDIAAELKQHRKSGRLITLAAVHPSARFGEMLADGDRIVRFDEKPARSSKYVNGGYMVVDRGFVEKYLADDPALVLEQAPMRNAAKDGNVTAFRHEGFWQCMDTLREFELLNALWKSGEAPWTRHWK
jgi:glucose-1-phosphate cytidylyltransferase